MLFSSWLRKKSQKPARLTHFRPQLELLDDRIVPSTLTVTNNLDDGSAGSLRGEIADAQNGDTIVFDTSLSGQTIVLYNNATGPGNELVINKNLTIQGPSAPLSPVTINGYLSRVFEVDGATTVVSLSNLNIMGGTGVAVFNSPHTGDGQGGAIWNGGTLTVSACNLSGNLCLSSSPVDLGGAIYNAGTLTVSNSTLDGNLAGRGSGNGGFGGGAGGAGDGGAIYNTGTLTVSNSTLSGNIAYTGPSSGGEGDGGAICNTGTLTVTYSTLSDNAAGYGGGGIFNASGASATITASSLSGNWAFDGGGIYNAYKTLMTITGCSISGNGSGDGVPNGPYFVPIAGGIYNGGTMTLSGVTLSGNGGGILNAKGGHLVITSMSSVVNNGIDLYNLGAVKISKDSYVGVIV